MKSCRNFRKLLETDCVPIIGAFNGLVARSVAEQGFKALYISGAAISASTGEPDVGLVTLEGFCQIIKDVHLSSGLPVLADADTGFGEGEMCAKTVWEYFNAGAAGLHLEDQLFPKRCGHLDGKSLIKAEDMVKKIEIAAEASKKCSNGEFIICARTDAKGVYGIQETIDRSKRYIDAGADMIFPEGLGNYEEFKIVADALKGYGPKGGPYLLANMTEFGKTDFISLEDFKKLGYNCVIYPVTTLRVAMKAVDLFLKHLMEHGTQEGFLEKMQTREELFNLLKYDPAKEWYFPNPTIHDIEFTQEEKKEEKKE